MAGKKDKSEKVEKMDSVSDSITKKYGKVCLDFDTLKEEQGRVIPLTLSLDIALNGGIQEGTSVTFSGITGSGKTTLSLTLAANAMRLDPQKRYIHVDAENRLNTSILKTIPGLDLDRITIVRSAKNAILHAEDNMNIMEEWITSESNILMTCDSIAALIPASAASNGMGESKQRTAIQQLLYDFLRRVSPKLMVQKSNLVMLTHTQDNPTPYGGPKEYGGNAQKFFSSTRLMCLSSKEFPDDGIKKEGRISKFKILKAGLTSCGNEADFPILYGKGYYREHDLISVAELMGLVEQSGSWYELAFDDVKEKIQGKDSLIEFLTNTQEVADKLEVKIRSLAFGDKE